MIQLESCDVAVIGGGPAGATAAFLLASRGYDVLLFDRRDFPRPKLCAGLLTWKSIALLQRVFGVSVNALKTKGLILHSCDEYRICYKMKEIGAGRLDFPFHFIDRSSYDHHWLQLAGEAGARTLTGIAVRAVDAQTGRLTLSDGRTFAARMIVGADGVGSKTRRCLPDGVGHQRWRTNLAATVEVRHPYKSATTPGVASLHFGYLPWGYAWSFPGKNAQTLGIAGLRTAQQGSIREAFQTFLNEAGCGQTAESAWKSHPLPYGNFLHRPAHGRLLLAGDACGLADPLLGEGIYYAHASGSIAAEAIIETNLSPAKASHLYAARLAKGLLRELRWIKLWRTALFAGGRHRRYRGLRLFCRLMPKRLEAAVQGQHCFSRLLIP